MDGAQDVHQRGLAGAVGPQEGKQFARLYLQAYALERFGASVALADIFYLYAQIRAGTHSRNHLRYCRFGSHALARVTGHIARLASLYSLTIPESVCRLGKRKSGRGRSEPNPAQQLAQWQEQCTDRIEGDERRQGQPDQQALPQDPLRQPGSDCGQRVTGRKWRQRNEVDGNEGGAHPGDRVEHGEGREGDAVRQGGDHQGAQRQEQQATARTASRPASGSSSAPRRPVRNWRASTLMGLIQPKENRNITTAPMRSRC